MIAFERLKAVPSTGVQSTEYLSGTISATVKRGGARACLGEAGAGVGAGARVVRSRTPTRRYVANAAKRKIVTRSEDRLWTAGGRSGSASSAVAVVDLRRTRRGRPGARSAPCSWKPVAFRRSSGVRRLRCASAITAFESVSVSVSECLCLRQCLSVCMCLSLTRVQAHLPTTSASDSLRFTCQGREKSWRCVESGAVTRGR